MIPIPNQPVYFGETNECNSDFEIHQLVDLTDKTQFQLALEPCFSAENLFEFPQFTETSEWELSANWSIADNLLCHSLGSEDPATALLTFTNDNYYQVQITVDSISFGSSFLVKLGLTELGTISTIGTYTFYGFYSDLGRDLGLTITPINDGAMCISEIKAYDVLINEIVQIRDLEDNVIATISNEDNPDYFVVSENSMTVTIDWNELEISAGCYKICVMDACENTNGQNYPAVIEHAFDRDSGDYWTVVGEVVFTDFQASMSCGTEREGVSIVQENVFKSFTNTYCITISLTLTSGEIDIYFGENKVETISTLGYGVYTVTGSCDGNFSLKIKNSVINTEVIIDYITPCYIAPEDYTCNFSSNTFKLADYSNDCTLLINACNNENGLGFVFGDSGFSPRIRLEAKLKTPKYTAERTIFEDSIGTKAVVYYSGRKSKNLAIDLQQEYVHDFLRLLGGFDNVYINGVEYVIEDDEYNIETVNEFDNIGKARILVSEKTQNVKNINCSSTKNSCKLQSNLLLQTNGDYLVQTNGSKIIING